MTDYHKLPKEQLIKELRRLQSELRRPVDDQEIHYLRHDLDVHQVELEMQNRELSEKQQELELTRDKYADLYDFAPISYLTLDNKGIILEINLTATGMLGQPRGLMLNKPFAALLAGGYSFDFFRTLREVLTTSEEQNLELLLRLNSNRTLDVLMSMIPSNSNKTEVRIALQNIGLRKQAEKKTLQLLQQNRDLTQRLFHVQEKERHHLALEIHDELGQWLTAVQLNAQTIIERNTDCNNETYESANIIKDGANHMHGSIRNILRSLRPTLLDELGLVDSLKELINQWQAQYPSIELTFSQNGDLDDFEDDLNITLFRVTQESLTNVAKYAEANHVTISLNREHVKNKQDSLLLTIEDDGKGMDLEAPGEGFGIIGMRERVIGIGGEFMLNSHVGKGVQIRAIFPI